MSDVRAAITGAAGNVGLLQSSYDNTVSLGERLTGEEYYMKVVEYPDLRYLVKSTQIPAHAREVIELFGELGVQVAQQGRYKNMVELPVAFTETIKGHLYKAMREMVAEKKYVTIEIGLYGESHATPEEQHLFTIHNAWIELDGCDLSAEDSALLAPSGTIHGSYFPK